MTGGKGEGSGVGVEGSREEYVEEELRLLGRPSRGKPQDRQERLELTKLSEDLSSSESARMLEVVCVTIIAKIYCFG